MNNEIKLTERQKLILFAIIEEYADVATPVGSVTLAKLFNVSSATIRSEMARLEELGYITSPHTSAGRIPTDYGYRYYVILIWGVVWKLMLRILNHRKLSQKNQFPNLF